MTDQPKWALRRSPTVEQAVQVEPATGCFFGLVDEYLQRWRTDGRSSCNNHDLALVPLQERPKALRCWAAHMHTGGIGMSSLKQSDVWCEMIERAPAEALAVVVERSAITGGPLTAALAAYRAAYPKEEPK